MFVLWVCRFWFRGICFACCGLVLWFLGFDFDLLCSLDLLWFWVFDLVIRFVCFVFVGI